MPCPSTTGCDKDCETCEYLNDKIEVIRCRDCYFLDPWELETLDYFGNVTETSHLYLCTHFRNRWTDKFHEVSPDGFCAWAERAD